MAKREEQQAQSGRRGFLKLGLGSVAGGAALAAGGLASTAAQAAPVRSEGGYAETEHVKTYYDTARF
ncbi:MAG: hypothetical protein RIC87_12220 [Kiloniellales bacterium]